MKPPADSVLERTRRLDIVAELVGDLGELEIANALIGLSNDLRDPWMHSDRARRVWVSAANDWERRRVPVDWDAAAAELLDRPTD